MAFHQEGIPFRCPDCNVPLISKTGTLNGARCPMCGNAKSARPAPDKWLMKRADTCWELAGQARMAGDTEGEQFYTAKARDYHAKAQV